MKIKNFEFKTIEELSGREMFCIERLRINTFVTEQKITLPELDNIDLSAIHVYRLNEEKTNALATCRIFQDEKGKWFLGRVAVDRATRGQKLGKKMLEAVHKYLKEEKGASHLSCHAQQYVQKFYESLGYKTKGEVFQEAGIAHIMMTKNLG
ncbi:GNAT family N-acetyltransferase [Lactobacillus sp. PV012]|uniref:GNAT family N-acetyltransferase n=1 Tax=Lactobacillus sp. PV012 TaxID=2594494 RepID=UPI00223FAE76|nr:GNAT family N-acetyltransferase [Lactobacillus sp. PV012]QNQ82222.1 GNAT family N-acetyltransferase [Lactobacillus sp. PV012]